MLSVSVFLFFYSEHLNMMTVRGEQRRTFNDTTLDVETTSGHDSGSLNKQRSENMLNLPYGFQYIQL